jgi:hypothetical protein
MGQVSNCRQECRRCLAARRARRRYQRSFTPAISFAKFMLLLSLMAHFAFQAKAQNEPPSPPAAPAAPEPAPPGLRDRASARATEWSQIKRILRTKFVSNIALTKG